MLIGNLYRSPSSSGENDAKLGKLIKKLTVKKSTTLLVGDFNFGGIQWNTDICDFTGLKQSEIKFVKTLKECYLDQFVIRPTRQRGRDIPHILDLVIASGDLVGDINYASPPGMSDHAVFCLNI